MSLYILSAPLENRILLDANNTLVSVQSTNGAGHYFRAFIYINEVLFDTQGWSRKTDYIAEKDLKKLYNAYFESVWNETFSNELTDQTHLIKGVNITIKEYLLEDDSEVQTIDLPLFYFMYTAKPVLFDDEPKAQILGIEPNILQVPANGKIAVPIFVNANTEILQVALYDSFDNLIDDQNVPSCNGKHAYLYGFDLSGYTVLENTTHFKLEITVGVTVLTKYFRHLAFPDFTVKEIAFLNNFGYWQHAYLDGQLSVDSALDIQTYEQKDGSEKIFEINEEETYIINSGSLIGTEKALIHQIVNALEAKLFFNGEWLDMVSKTKKFNVYKERGNNYSENLSFSIRKNKAVANTAMYLD